MKSYDRIDISKAQEAIDKCIEEYAGDWPSKRRSMKKKGKELIALMEKALKGEATAQDMRPIARDFANKYWMRGVYTACVSWPLYSKEYISSVHRLASALGGGKGTLEVCAGSGLLGAPNWVTTDAVDGLDALEACEIYGDKEVLFASWICYGSELDYKLTHKWVVEQGKPFILLGEGNGCTGSELFWKRADVEYRVLRSYQIRERYPWFRDVPSWDGIYDETFLVLPLREEDYHLEVPAAHGACPSCGCAHEECEC